MIIEGTEECRRVPKRAQWISSREKDFAFFSSQRSALIDEQFFRSLSGVFFPLPNGQRRSKKKRERAPIRVGTSSTISCCFVLHVFGKRDRQRSNFFRLRFRSSLNLCDASTGVRPPLAVLEGQGREREEQRGGKESTYPGGTRMANRGTERRNRTETESPSAGERTAVWRGRGRFLISPFLLPQYLPCLACLIYKAWVRPPSRIPRPRTLSPPSLPKHLPFNHARRSSRHRQRHRRQRAQECLGRHSLCASSLSLSTRFSHVLTVVRPM